jgi:hypothetical protein
MGRFLTVSSTLQCPHGGSVSISTTNTRAKADGGFIARATDTFTIAGCPFTLPSGTPHPCVRVDWVTSARRVDAAHGDALVEDSVGLCLAADGAPQGTVLVANTQLRAKGR